MAVKWVVVSVETNLLQTYLMLRILQLCLKHAFFRISLTQFCLQCVNLTVQLTELVLHLCFCLC